MSVPIDVLLNKTPTMEHWAGKTDYLIMLNMTNLIKIVN